MNRILFVTPGCFDKGGISRYSRYQIRALRELYGKEHVRVLSLLGPDESSFEDPIEVDWHGRGASFGDKKALALRVFREVLTWRPSVVHAAHINFAGMTVAASKLIGATSLLNTYGLEVWSDPSRDAIWGLKRSTHVLSDCHFTANYLEESRFRDRGSVHVIWDCVDLEQFNPDVEIGGALAKYGIPDPAKYFNILTLGRLAHEAMHKGYDRLLEVFVTVLKEQPQSRLVIAGRGEAADFLKCRAQELGIADCVVFTGSVDDADLASVYRTCSVFSLVSDRGHGRGEGIPLTPLEAMGCGAPVIVGNQDGSQEAVFDNSNGFVVDPFDFPCHAAKLVQLSADQALQRKMSLAASDVARNKFSYERFKASHLRLFREISS